MNTTPTDEAVLKQDVLGRVKTPKARREQLLDEFERSGLPGLKFAELAGIKYPTFATWAQKRRRQRGDYATGKLGAAKKSVQWLEAVLAPPPGSVVPAGALSLVLHLPGGVRMSQASTATNTFKLPEKLSMARPTPAPATPPVPLAFRQPLPPAPRRATATPARYQLQ